MEYSREPTGAGNANKKGRLRKTKMSKINQARVVEAIVESSILFDCAVRPFEYWRTKFTAESAG